MVLLAGLPLARQIVSSFPLDASSSHVRRALMGVNAAVVGILAAALYEPVWTSAVHQPRDLAIGLGAFGLLAFWKVPPWLVVAGAALAGWLLLSN